MRSITVPPLIDYYCLYVGITDAAVHALVADGHHGRDRIQDVRCQACQT